MKYRAPEPRSNAESEIFLDGRPEEVSEALIAAALYGEDREWAEGWVVRLSQHENPSTRSAAAVSLGHLARLHGEVSEAAVEAVRALLTDELTAGSAGDGLDDVAMFCRSERPARRGTEFPIRQFRVISQVLMEIPNLAWDQAPAEWNSDGAVGRAHMVARSARRAAWEGVASRIVFEAAGARQQSEESPPAVEQVGGELIVRASAAEANLPLWPPIFEYIIQALGERETFLRTGYTASEIKSALALLEEKVQDLQA